MNGKWKEAIMLLLEPSTNEELQEMLEDPFWSEGTKECMRETLAARNASAAV